MIASSAHHHPGSLATPGGGEELPVLLDEAGLPVLRLDGVSVGIGRTIIQNGWE